MTKTAKLRRITTRESHRASPVHPTGASATVPQFAPSESRPASGATERRAAAVPELPLLHRLAQGGDAAVREALETFGTLVWSIARRHHVDRSEAEDAVQEVFLDLWRTAARFDPAQGSEATFVATIAHRRCIDRHRRAEARPRFEEVGPGFDRGGAPDDESVEREEEGDLVRRELAALRPQQRTVLELGFLGGLSHSQIAERLGMPLGTVKTHARRGLRRLKEALLETSLAASVV
jgi:RNA polymerase sigma-70 factor (ECF subfamily)